MPKRRSFVPSSTFRPPARHSFAKDLARLPLRGREQEHQGVRRDERGVQREEIVVLVADWRQQLRTWRSLEKRRRRCQGSGARPQRGG
jgi:hypothetical protein